MVDLMKYEFHYHAPYTVENVAAVLRGLAEAVDENWLLRDQWSPPRPNPPVDVQAWLRRCGPERLARDDIFKCWRPKGEKQTGWGFEEFSFAFSPLSTKTCSIAFIKSRSGLMIAHGLIYASVLYELQGDREIERMKEAWDSIRAARGEPEPREVGPDEDHPDVEEWCDRLRDLEETFSVWPQNKRCLRNILAKLGSALPVRRTEVDERLRGEDRVPLTEEHLRGARSLFKQG